MAEESTARVETARVRRVPKYGVFIALGAVLGVIAALILTFAFDGTVGISENTGLEYSAGQVFGFVLLGCIPVGIALAALVALLLDRLARRKTREVRIVHDRVRVTDDEGIAPEPAATPASPATASPYAPAATTAPVAEPSAEPDEPRELDEPREPTA